MLKTRCLDDVEIFYRHNLRHCNYSNQKSSNILATHPNQKIWNDQRALIALLLRTRNIFLDTFFHLRYLDNWECFMRHKWRRF